MKKNGYMYIITESVCLVSETNIVNQLYHQYKIKIKLKKLTFKKISFSSIIITKISGARDMWPCVC